MISNIILQGIGAAFARPFDSANGATNSTLILYLLILLIIVISIIYIIIKVKLYNKKMAHISEFNINEISLERECNENHLNVIIKDINTNEKLFTLFSDYFDKNEGWVSITNSYEINGNWHIPVVKYSLKQFIELSKSAGFKEVISEINLNEMYKIKDLKIFYRENQFKIDFNTGTNIAKARYLIQ
ncbi:MAG: hypothetical protein HXX18_11090 [Bacteroidetes bacterium]|nr:hypothetical protein [Bacteroidota bacterium]